MKPDLDKLKDLSDEQLQKICADVEKDGIRQAAVQASLDNNKAIDKTCVQRLKERSIARKFLIESPDAAEAAKEILRFAVTGSPDFSEATIKVLDQTAFQLSLNCTQSEDEMKALNSLSVMLARYKSSAVRDRMAKIQEDKLQLRREEFEWKKSIHVAKQKTEPKKEEEEESDDLGQLARNLDDVERRACEMFKLPYNGPSEPQSIAADAHSVQADPAPTAQTKSETASFNQNPSNDCQPYLQPEKNASPATVQTEKLDTANSDTSHSNGTGPYLQTEKDSSAAANPVNPTSPQRANSETDSNIEKLDLGHADSSRPYLQTKKNHDDLASTEVDPKDSNPCKSEPSAVKGDPIPHKVKDHAIRRWRAHIPRPPGTPEPDGSWREECPCGNPLPCAEHHEMQLRARYYRPQHPEFKHLLEEAGVPYYIPTPEEIGCTKQELERSLDHFANNPQIPNPVDPKFNCLFQPGDNPYVWPGGIPLT